MEVKEAQILEILEWAEDHHLQAEQEEPQEHSKMKKIIFILLTLVFLAGFATAVVNEPNLIKYGTINSNGDLTTTNTPITNVNIIGFVCANNDCSSTSGALFSGQTLNTGSSSSITLQYPTTLQDLGYGIFVYKDGYIPYEVKVTYNGNGNAPTATDYLTRKEICFSELSNVQVTNSSSEIIVKADVKSPLSHAGPLNLVPNQIKDQYTVNVQVELQVSGATSKTETKTINLEFSEEKEVEFTIPANPGIYDIKLQSSTNDQKCLASQSDEETKQYTIAQLPVIICSSNAQCNDNNASTSDICVNPGTPQSYCQKTPILPIACSTNAQCSDGNPLTYDQCNNPGTPQSSCTNTPIACASNADCGLDSFIGNPFCSSNIVKKLFASYQCNNPGQLNAQCVTNQVNQTVQTCPDFCANGQCQAFACTSNSQCGSVSESQPFCQSGNIYKNVTSPICNNPSTSNAQCSSSSQNVLVQTCNNGCSVGACLPPTQTNQTLSLIIISPENKTYSTNLILVNLSTVNATLVKYSINGGANVTYNAPVLVSFSNGSNILTAFASNSQNLLSKFVVFSVSIQNQTNVTDTTPPASVTNLTLTGKSETFLKWSWINPQDPDFSKVIVYLDGINVLNTTSNMYTATNLLPDSTHTITLNTIDINGNINNTAVSNTATTDKHVSPGGNGGGNNGGGNGGSSNKGKKLLFPTDYDPNARNATSTYYDFESQNITLQNPKRNSQININWKFWLFILFFLCLLLILLIIILAAVKRN
ncbi:hypothetical protein J4408_03425 [Candidatus Pacearchaeota archaeon]|nr:hypothetical protein [Candidatus Pacearchaeota archaeon]